MAHVRSGRAARERRQESAKERLADRVEGRKDRLAILDMRLGKNEGALRERVELSK
jgi:hypothetical protein